MLNICNSVLHFSSSSSSDFILMQPPPMLQSKTASLFCCYPLRLNSTSAATTEATSGSGLSQKVHTFCSPQEAQNHRPAGQPASKPAKRTYKINSTIAAHVIIIEQQHWRRPAFLSTNLVLLASLLLLLFFFASFVFTLKLSLCHFSILFAWLNCYNCGFAGKLDFGRRRFCTTS